MSFRVRAEPAQTIDGILGPFALHNQPNRIRKAARIMRYVGGEQEHFSLTNGHVLELVLADYFEQHVAFDLVEPFFGFVHVVIISRVWPSDYHRDEVMAIIDAEIINGWLEFFAILLDPLLEVNRWCQYLLDDDADGNTRNDSEIGTVSGSES